MLINPVLHVVQHVTELIRLELSDFVLYGCLLCVLGDLLGFFSQFLKMYWHNLNFYVVI